MSSEAIVIELHDRVWSGSDYAVIERLVAARYHIYSDPGDPWEGQVLDHPTYRERVQFHGPRFPTSCSPSTRRWRRTVEWLSDGAPLELTWAIYAGSRQPGST